MKSSLIIDDLFLDRAYKSFLRYYAPVYGDEIKRPLALTQLTAAVVSYLGSRIDGMTMESHVFYVPERPSSFTLNHSRAIRSLTLPEISPERPVNGSHLPHLLAQSSDVVFHESYLLAINASEFARKCNFPIVMADDPVYGLVARKSPLIFIRLGNEETRMPSEIDWVDVSYVFCKAYGVEI